MNLDTATLITAIIPTVVILGVGWVLKRVVRANKADTTDAIRAAVTESETRIKAHQDRRFDSLERRVDQQGDRLDVTTKDVAWLFGRMGETPPSASTGGL